ncbi:MAG: hypothetical protein J6B62_00995, partial [Bacteroidales bacterium]|nr:hypothetical protein [Bacteroidales bacterium]
MNRNHWQGLTAALACTALLCSCKDEKTIPEQPVPATVSLTADATVIQMDRSNGTATFTLSKDEASASRTAAVKVEVDRTYSPASGEAVIPETGSCYTIDIDEFVFTEKESTPKTGTVTFYVEGIEQLASGNPSADFFVLPLTVTADDGDTTIDEDNSSVILKVSYNKPLPTLAITTEVTDKIVLTNGNLTASFKVAYAQGSDNSDLPASAHIVAMSAAELPGMELLASDAYSIEPAEAQLNGAAGEVSGTVTFDMDKVAAAWSEGKELSVGVKLTGDNALIAEDAGNVIFTISGVSELEALAFDLEKMQMYTDNYTAALAGGVRFVPEYTYSYRVSAEENGESVAGLSPIVFDSTLDKFIINSYLTNEIAEA